MNGDPGEAYLSRKELAGRLGVHISTVCEWESRWLHFPVHRMGGRVLYLISEVERFWLTHKGHEKERCPRLSRGKMRKKTTDEYGCLRMPSEIEEKPEKS